MTENQDPIWSIVCPHCGHRHTDWQNYIDTDDMSGTFDMTCENEECLALFDVKYDTHISFKTKKPNQPQFSGKPTAEELLTQWEKDLGYAKAMLIAHGYRLNAVLAMTQRDAESEIEAISQ